MTRIRVKGFKIFADRFGHQRCYHRKTGEKIDLKRTPLGTSEFFAEVARIGAKQEPKALQPGTLGLLIADYRQHAAFTDLAPQTRADYQKVFDYLKDIDGTHLARFKREFVVKLRDKAAETKGRRFANYVKAVLSLLFSWGSERGYMETNTASGIKDLRKKRGTPDRNRPWTDTEREAVLEHAPPHIKVAMALMMFTGLGPKDALTLKKDQYKDGEISTSRSKTGERVFWPVPFPLRMILAAAPEHDAETLCANSDGKPWTLSGFRASWRTVRIKLEKAGRVQSGLTPYGLRHTLAVILREIGHDERAIADALGQRTIEMARHYAKGADLAPKMRKVVNTLDEEFERRIKPSDKPARKASNPETEPSPASQEIV
ncbi:Site-specific recombinase, phage integrase family [Methylorubrum extorquens]|uniref:Site-specific recombinase, phage integrase family n=1 Tax=Methylorubrum extorquens TaxID=408 RepID=A0A2N9AHD8_METEX|nr:Site-specific recombinase, phage integrase family [Methylorubrum extorquens]